MPAYEAISSTTVGTATASITFSSVPQTYEHLEIRLFARGSAAATLANVTLRINSDTASNYVLSSLEGSGTGVSGLRFGASTSLSIAHVSGDTAAANIFGCGIIFFADYANTTGNKTITSISGNDRDGSGSVFFRNGLWKSNSAISTIELTLSNFMVGSVVSLYGLRSA